MKKETRSAILGLAFALLLAAACILHLVCPDQTFSEEENRVLQAKPQFSLSSYMQGRFEKRLEKYVSDQFPARNTWIKIKTAGDRTLGKRDSNAVYLCDDHYLMEAITLPDRDDMDRLLAAMKAFRKRHADMPMYFLLAPNAANILSDRLPAFVRMEDQDAAMDKFFADIDALDYQPIDVRKALRRYADSDTQIYYKTDHHWTSDGAFIAYKTAAKRMDLDDDVRYRRYVVKNDFRGTLASRSGITNGENDALTIYLPREGQEAYHNSVIYYADTKTKTTEFYQLDNLATKDAYTVFGGSNHPMYTIKTPVETREKLLLVKDSYANSMIPFLAQNYREIVVVDPRYFFGNIETLMKKEDITQVLFLYNGNTFFSDHALALMLDAKAAQGKGSGSGDKTNTKKKNG